MTQSKRSPARLSGPLRVHACGVLAVAGISGAAYFGIVRVLINRDAPIRQLLADINARGEEARAAEDAAGDSRRRLAELERNPPAVKLESADLINQRLVRITNKAVAAGLSIDQMTPGTPAPAARFVTVPVKISGTCTYPGLSRFVHELRREFPDSAITTLQVSGNPADPTSRASFAAEIAWFAAPAVSAAATDKP